MALAWYALGNIYYNNELAYKANDLVPDANVAAYGYDAQGLVQQRTVTTPPPSNGGIAFLDTTTASATYVPLSGTATLGIPQDPTRLILKNPTPSTGLDYATAEVRRVASHAGGTFGNCCSSFVVTSYVQGTGITNFEFGLLATMQNSANAGENTSAYLQAYRETTTTGPTWASTIEVRDLSGQANPTIGLTALEVDCFAAGTDNNNQRTGVFVAIGKAASGSANPTVFAGVQLVAGSGLGGGQYQNGFLLSTSAYATFGLALAGTTYEGIYITGASTDSSIAVANSAQIGLNLSGGTFATSAIRLKRQAIIDLTSDSYYQIGVLGAADNIVRFQGAGTEIIGLDLNNNALRIGQTQVVGARSTGWSGGWTGTTDKTSTFTISTATTAQVAARVAAIEAALRTHGLIGT